MTVDVAARTLLLALADGCGSEALTEVTPAAARWTADGETHEGRILGLAVCNARTVGGGRVLAPDADPADGLLDVVVVPDAPRDRLLALATQLGTEALADQPFLRRHRCRELTLETDQDLAVNIDGDLVGAARDWTWRVTPSSRPWIGIPDLGG